MTWLDELVGTCDRCGAPLTRLSPRALDPYRERADGTPAPRTLGCLSCKRPDLELEQGEPPHFVLADGTVWARPPAGSWSAQRERERSSSKATVKPAQERLL